MNGFTIELASDFTGWEHYNVRMMCELQDDNGRRTGFASVREKHDGRCVLETGPCSRVRLFVYVIPESLPVDRDVCRQPDFAAVLRVSCDGRKVAEEQVAINRWGGASVERTFRNQD